MKFDVVKAENGYIVVVTRGGFSGMIEKPDRYVCNTVDDVFEKVRSLLTSS